MALDSRMDFRDAQSSRAFCEQFASWYVRWQLLLSSHWHTITSVVQWFIRRQRVAAESIFTNALPSLIKTHAARVSSFSSSVYGATDCGGCAITRLRWQLVTLLLLERILFKQTAKFAQCTRAQIVAATIINLNVAWVARDRFLRPRVLSTLSKGRRCSLYNARATVVRMFHFGCYCAAFERARFLCRSTRSYVKSGHLSMLAAGTNHAYKTDRKCSMMCTVT